MPDAQINRRQSSVWTWTMQFLLVSAIIVLGIRQYRLNEELDGLRSGVGSINVRLSGQMGDIWMTAASSKDPWQLHRNLQKLDLSPMRAERAGRKIGQTEADEDKPWDNPRVVSKLEWLCIDLQAHFGTTQLGADGIAVDFTFGPRSFQEGVVYCSIQYVSGTRAEVVDAAESHIKRVFESQKKLEPWAKIEFERRSLGNK